MPEHVARAESEAANPRARFRALLSAPDMVVMPGGFSPVYAAMAESAGFEAFFVAGSQVSAFLYGVPDVGIVGLRDMVDHVRHVQARVAIPVLADGDTGYGNAVNVYYAVREFVRSGVAGVQIEDQEAPKKSGTSAGRRVISIEEAVGKYRAADRARNEIDPEFVICARCDLIGAENGTVDEAIDRCIAYATDGGADFVWLNSVQSLDDLSRACAAIPVPVMTIWGGPRPAPGLEALRETGVKIVLYPVIAAAAGMQAAWGVLNDFSSRGTQALEDWAAGVNQMPWGAAQLASLVRGDEVRALEEEVLPAALQRDYGSTFGHAGAVAAHDTTPPA